LFVPCKVATIPRKMQKKSGDHPFREDLAKLWL